MFYAAAARWLSNICGVKILEEVTFLYGRCFHVTNELFQLFF